MPRRPGYLLRLPAVLDLLARPGEEDFGTSSVARLLGCSQSTARRLLRSTRGVRRIGGNLVASREVLCRHLEGVLRGHLEIVESVSRHLTPAEVIESPAGEEVERVRFEPGRVVIEAGGTKELLRTMAAIVAEVKRLDRRRAIEARLQGRDA